MSAIHFYHHAAEARRALGLPGQPETDRVEELYPVLVNSYYLGLTDPAAGAGDPIFRQWHPDPRELDDRESSCDPLAEAEQMPVARIIHRFADRVVLLATGRCAMRCRFCFRKRAWTAGTELADISDAELAGARAYLDSHPEVKEVLISGGDPLFLPTARLERILDAVAASPAIEVIRVASRLPAVLPMAVSEEKIALLARYEGLWLATHFNHPREVSPEAESCLRQLVRAGIPVINQTVLLKGVNDDAAILEALFRKLIRLKVKPHYLFHVDPVRGVRHFATGIAAGLEALRAFRGRLSSLAVPTFAIDLPEGGGKVALQPSYEQDGCYFDIHESKLIPYPDR